MTADIDIKFQIVVVGHVQAERTLSRILLAVRSYELCRNNISDGQVYIDMGQQPGASINIPAAAVPRPTHKTTRKAVAEAASAPPDRSRKRLGIAGTGGLTIIKLLKAISDATNPDPTAS